MRKSNVGSRSSGQKASNTEKAAQQGSTATNGARFLMAFTKCSVSALPLNDSPNCLAIVSSLGMLVLAEMAFLRLPSLQAGSGEHGL